MIIPANPVLASFCPVFVTPIVATPSGPLRMRGATAFFYKRGAELYLVTAWHVATGRRPDDRALLLDRYPQSPNSLDLTYFVVSEDGKPIYIEAEVDLYVDGMSIWLENAEDKSIDIAVIKLGTEFDSRIVHLPNMRDASEQDGSHPDVGIKIGAEVIITGFPIERCRDNLLPIWKKAMVASEPSIISFGTPQVLVDTPAHPGMSGSPVYWNRTGAHTRFSLRGYNAQADISFAGIYVGSTRNKILDRLNIGRIYLEKSIIEVIDYGSEGNSDYKPISTF